MRRLAATALALLAAAIAFPAAGAAEPTATAACTQAVIDGQSKCIARGQYCKRSARAMRDYAKYGLRCTKRDAYGRYHLQ
jgi:predicted outer membrane protein